MSDRGFGSASREAIHGLKGPVPITMASTMASTMACTRTSRRLDAPRVLACVGLFGAGVAATAQADYTLFATWAGGPSQPGQPAVPIVAPPGSLVSVQVVIDGETAFDFHNSCLFRVECSTPGITLADVAWALPYESESLFNLSTPAPWELPVVLGPDLLVGPAYPDDVVDVELANVTVPFGGLPPPFTEGVLVELGLSIPQPWDGPTLVTVKAVPDTFAYGAILKPTTQGPGQSILIADPDFDGDGTIDGSDLGLLLSAWGFCAASLGDLDGSGTVDSGDLGLLLAAFGGPGPLGDLDQSRFVDSGDLGLLLAAFGQSVPLCADLNADGVVDGADVGLFLSAWGF